MPAASAEVGGQRYLGTRPDLQPGSAECFSRRRGPARAASRGTFQPRPPSPGTCTTATSEGKLEPGAAVDPGTGNGGGVQQRYGGQLATGYQLCRCSAGPGSPAIAQLAPVARSVHQRVSKPRPVRSDGVRVWERNGSGGALSAAVRRGHRARLNAADVLERRATAALPGCALSSHRGGQGFKSPQLHREIAGQATHSSGLRIAQWRKAITATQGAHLTVMR